MRSLALHSCLLPWHLLLCLPSAAGLGVHASSPGFPPSISPTLPACLSLYCPRTSPCPAVHLCFICVLHLANEHGLVIQPVPELDRLLISNVPAADHHQ